MAIPALLGRTAAGLLGRGLARSAARSAVLNAINNPSTASTGVYVNNGRAVAMLDQLSHMGDQIMPPAGEYFRNITPVREGNAKRNTSTRGKTIHAKYPYAGRLNEGYSKQAPKGMVDPTIDHMRKLVKDFVGDLNRG